MENDNQPLNAAKNNKGIRGEVDSVIGRISDETIKTDKLANQFPEIEEDSKDLDPAEFTGGLDAPADSSADADPEIAHTNDLPHSFEHTFDSETLDQGTQVRGMPKSAKLDSPADSGSK